jgi:hypothetical protein
VSYLQNYFDSFFNHKTPKNKKFITKRKRMKCKLEHEKMIFFPECELQRGNQADNRNPKIVINLEYLGNAITLLSSRVFANSILISRIQESPLMD